MKFRAERVFCIFSVDSTACRDGMCRAGSVDG